MSTVLLVLLLGAPADAKIDTIVVCPSEFRAALEPWVAHRQGQGHRLGFISNLKSPDELRATIRRIATTQPVRYLVLVGDADPVMDRHPTARAHSVPTHYALAEVNVRFGSEPEIAADNWYADLNDDRVPELAVGRLTADSAAELQRIVRKILAYETCADFGHWRRQVHFVAGLGGFGSMADTVLEAATKTLITTGIPAAYATTMTYGNWQSPYCPDPRQFQRVTLQRLNEGSLFWVYIGHGQPRSVDVVRTPAGSYPILSCPDTRQLDCRHGAPIACFLACYAGAFDQQRDCLAEEMLRAERGPVAVVCGSRVTLPYAMATLGAELLDQCFHKHPLTIGDAILEAKRRSVGPATSSLRLALDATAKALWPAGTDLEAERIEHLDLFHLLGDPLLRLPHPRPLDVRVGPTAVSGRPLEVSGRSPLDGTCTVELVVRRDRLTFQPPPRGQFDPRSLAQYAEIYERANEPRLASRKLELVEGMFHTELDVPPEARGACHVRVFVEGSRDCAAGAADVRLEPPREAAAN
jgi:hypothetical protein